MEGDPGPPTPSVDDSLDSLIVSGGDERLDTDPAGRNKYHLDPIVGAGALHRGSCTCSPLTVPARDAAQRALDRMRSRDSTPGELVDLQRERLLDIFVPSSHEGAGVVFAPSGSDLCYLPLLFHSVLDPGRRIVNVVATSEELGSGSLLAHDGRFFAAESQVERGLAAGEPLSPRLDVELVTLPARDGAGEIVDQAAAIEAIIARRDPSDVLVVNLVIGSKSGIENGVRIIERHADADITWTVDLCQMRTRPALFEHLLDLGCLLLCTGSKFYEAPPFCGAMLLPGGWMDRLGDLPGAVPDGFDRIFTSRDFPSALGSLAAHFADVDNIGLLLRWEAALFEMEAFDAVPETESADVIDRWHRAVVERLEASPELDLLGDQDRTNDSIVSFRVADGRGGHLDVDGLAEIHRRLAVDGAAAVEPFERATIGQPVSYVSGSFLRLALGSSQVRRFVADGFDPGDDLALVSALESVAVEVAARVAAEVAAERHGDVGSVEPEPLVDR